MSLPERNTEPRAAAPSLIEGSDAPALHHADERTSVAMLAAAACVFCLALTLFASQALQSGSLHPDMTEAWAWGKEFQLGYDKHPPLSGWIAGIWFSAMPRADWSFYLLSSVNALVGLAGAWMLAGQFLDVKGRWAVVLLLALTPSFTLWAVKFNANAPLLSTWPWATYFFVRSLRTRGTHVSLVAGVVAGLAMLAKYSSVVLLFSMLFAAMLHPARATYFRSRAPWLVALGAVVVASPHVWWMVVAGYPTVDYALSKTQYPVAQALEHSSLVFAGSVGALLVSAVAWIAAFAGHLTKQIRNLRSGLQTEATAWLAMLALGPLCLTLTTVIGNVRLGGGYLIPVFFAVPVALLVLSQAQVTSRVIARLAACVALVWLPLLAVAPVLAHRAATGGNAFAAEPRAEVALVATKVWHAAFSEPLRYVAGTPALATAATFYSPDQPSLASLGEPAVAPWATPKLIERDGLLIICRAEDAACTSKAARFVAAGAISYSDQFASAAGVPVKFIFTMLPPADADIVWD